MLTFTDAVRKVDLTGLPVTEGFAVELKDKADVKTVQAEATVALNTRLPGQGWTAEEVLPDGSLGWLMFRSSGGASVAAPPLGQAWEAVRNLKAISGVAGAEPLLLARLPVTNGSEAQRTFALWGRVSDDRLKRIQEQSDANHRHWSLEQMGVSDAWTIWKAKHGTKTPGEDILVAHPDTGYTNHQRLVSRLVTRPQDPGGHHGRNFVERDRADAKTNGFDPMADRSFANFPGHGTGTASVIAAADSPADQPWGVAPGAKILPLRVSSSVIHLSFQNVCDAFVEAMNRGAHVISMSLGGPLGSGLLNSLVRHALDQGIIVVSAAGNNAPTVVFPARIPGVIACAASNALGAPWRFSGMGAEVAITAPGELVWHDWARIDGNGKPVDDQTNGNGTSFATANVAGLAALWLSYHGRDDLIKNHCGNRPELLPFLFRLCLQKSSDKTPKFIRGGGFGAGIARADQLLSANLPSSADVEKERSRIFSQPSSGVIGFPASSWWTVLTLPTLTKEGPRISPPAESAARDQRLMTLLGQIVGLDCDGDDRAELGALAATDALLQKVLEQAGRGGRNTISAAAVRRYLLRKETVLSKALRKKLKAAWEEAQKEWCGKHPELTPTYELPSAEAEEKKIAYAIESPPTRRLRAFAFDPSLATSSASAAANEITIPVVFERGLEPGPVGDYLAVVDVDPASDCAYAPVDLNHPFLLAQDGLSRSEGNPQFHQQMVYAVAMKTISHFEEALGRPIFWSPLRPWDPLSDDKDRALEQPKKDVTGNVVMDDKGRVE